MKETWANGTKETTICRCGARPGKPCCPDDCAMNEAMEDAEKQELRKRMSEILPRNNRDDGLPF